MSFKENLRNRIGLDKLVEKIKGSMLESPGKHYANKESVRALLAMTDFKHVKTRDLHLYTRLPEGVVVGEVLVLDNELPIYRSSVEDIAMRKTPNWKEMLSVGNVRKIMDDRDVLVSKGRRTVERLREAAAARIDLSYTAEDMAEMAREAREIFEAGSLARIVEALELFFWLLEFETVDPGFQENDFLVYSRPEGGGDEGEATYEDVILFSAERLDLFLLKGRFSLDSDLAIARVIDCARGGRMADLRGGEVFGYLAELALRRRRWLEENRGARLRA